MFRFFDLDGSTSRYSNKSTSFRHLRGMVMTEIEKLQLYYNKANFSVKNQHLLVTLITSLNVSLNRDDETYVDHVKDSVTKLYKGLGITSNLQTGHVFDEGVFYNTRVAEIIIAANEPFDVTYARKNWRKLEPVRVMSHPFTDLSMDELDGNYRGSSESGLAVILINIPMLALQYKVWVDEIASKTELSSERLHQFLYAYPLTNMLRSHLDLVFMNRIIHTFYDEPMAGFKRLIPRAIPNFTDRVQMEVEKTLTILKQQDTQWTMAMYQIPAFTKDNMLDRLHTPDILINRYVKGPLLMGWFKYINFLYDLDQTYDGNVNMDVIRDLRILVRTLDNDSLAGRYLPASYQNKINILRQKLGR